MSNTKYLSDGRKVAIVGQLNNTEWIVQEIFVTESGDEIPSGERFTTGSLHDQPLESFLSREKKKHQDYIKNAELNLKRIQYDIAEARGKLEAKKAMLANSPELKEFAGEKAKLFSMLMTGTVPYVVVESYGIEKPVRLEDIVPELEVKYGISKFSGLRLISILGVSRGDIEYRINDYPGHTGLSTRIFPFETYEEAAEKVRELAIQKGKRLSLEDVKVCKELGIKLPDEVLQEVFHALSTSINSKILNYDLQIETIKSKRSEAEEELKTLHDNLFMEIQHEQ